MFVGLYFFFIFFLCKEKIQYILNIDKTRIQLNACKKSRLDTRILFIPCIKIVRGFVRRINDGCCRSQKTGETFGK